MGRQYAGTIPLDGSPGEKGTLHFHRRLRVGVRSSNICQKNWNTKGVAIIVIDQEEDRIIQVKVHSMPWRIIGCASVSENCREITFR